MYEEHVFSVSRIGISVDETYCFGETDTYIFHEDHGLTVVGNMIFYHMILKFYDHEIWSVIYVIYKNGHSEHVVFSAYSQQQHIFRGRLGEHLLR